MTAVLKQSSKATCARQQQQDLPQHSWVQEDPSSTIQSMALTIILCPFKV